MMKEHERLSKNLKQGEESEKFIVNKITASEFLGSFLTENSNKEKSRGKEHSQMLEEKKDEMAQMILNQSHESCCCSDDEFYSRKNSQGDERINTNTKML